MTISFAWTTPALVARRKTVTRRAWKQVHAQKFRDGDLVDAYDRSPRVGGRKVATVQVVGSPTLERVSDMPDSDYEAEGFAYLHETASTWLSSTPLSSILTGASLAYRQTVEKLVHDSSWAAFDLWRKDGSVLWVIRFDVVEVLSR